MNPETSEIRQSGGALPDFMIEQLCKIVPFSRGEKRPGEISYGLGHYGYDLRVANEFLVFKPFLDTCVDPKNLDQRLLVPVTVKDHEALVIPPNSFCLANTVEWLEVPEDCIGIVIGKSSYARCGILTNITPLEPCVSEDTDVLAFDGWKSIVDIQIGDEILTRRQDGVAEYHSVVEKQNRPYQGEMLHFGGRSVDQLVTPDHKLFVLFRNTRANKESERLVSAEDVFGKFNYSFDRRVNWPGVDSGDTIRVGEQLHDTNDFLEFLGCYLGDGSAYRPRNGGYEVKLAVVTKEKKRERFRNVLERLGVKFGEHESGFRFSCRDICLFLMQFGHARAKYIHRDFLALPPERLKHLLRGLMYSDGTESTNTYTTTSPQLADDVQELAFKCGFAAIVRRVEEEAFGSRIVAYKIRVCDNHLTPKINPDSHYAIQYQGMVYDVTVPNHIFFTRRNGKACWTGNCWRGVVTMEISNTCPCPAKIYAGEGIAQVVFIRGVERSKTTYATKEGKYQDQAGIVLPKVD